jgi:hypothetical protein
MSYKILKVSIDRFSESDVDILMQYWYESPEDYIKSMGIRRDKMLKREEFSQRMKDKIRSEDRLFSYLSIKLDSNTIGCHSLTDLNVSHSAVMHAHVFFEEYRRKGVGRISYVLAIKKYFELFDLKKIIFKTPKMNKGPNILKSKYLGLNPIGEEASTSPVLEKGLPLLVYEMSREYFNEKFTSRIQNESFHLLKK